MFGSALGVAIFCISCSRTSGPALGENGPPMVIEPNIAVGGIRAGMRTNDVIKLLGKPERSTANAIEYTRLGFAVMPSPDGIVQVVMCGDVTGLNGPLVKAFTGRTKDGIGLGSRREELLKVYGEPTTAEKLTGNTESLRYDNLGMTFTLQSGKIYHIIIRLRGEQQVAPAITVDLPATSAAK